MPIDIGSTPMEGLYRETNIANVICGSAYHANNVLVKPGTLTVDSFVKSGFGTKYSYTNKDLKVRAREGKAPPETLNKMDIVTRVLISTLSTN